MTDFNTCHGVYEHLKQCYSSYETSVDIALPAVSGLNICPAEADSGAWLDGEYEIAFVAPSGGRVVFNDHFIPELSRFDQFPYMEFFSWLRSCVKVFKYGRIDY